MQAPRADAVDQTSCRLIIGSPREAPSNNPLQRPIHSRFDPLAFRLPLLDTGGSRSIAHTRLRLRLRASESAPSLPRPAARNTRTGQLPHVRQHLPPRLAAVAYVWQICRKERQAFEGSRHCQLRIPLFARFSIGARS